MVDGLIAVAMGLADSASQSRAADTLSMALTEAQQISGRWRGEALKKIAVAQAEVGDIPGARKTLWEFRRSGLAAGYLSNADGLSSIRFYLAYANAEAGNIEEALYLATNLDEYRRDMVYWEASMFRAGLDDFIGSVELIGMMYDESFRYHAFGHLAGFLVKRGL